MAQHISSIAFGDGNQGFQVGPSSAPIHENFYLPQAPTRPQPEPTPPSSAWIPLRRNPIFVNRRDILDQINKQCSQPASRVALVGLGGMGKFQLAIEFTHRFSAGLTEAWVFWINAGTQARVEGFKSIAEKVSLMGHNSPGVDILQLVYDWLSDGRNGRWLLVFDSADDKYAFVENIDGEE